MARGRSIPGTIILSCLLLQGLACKSMEAANHEQAQRSREQAMEQQRQIKAPSVSLEEKIGKKEKIVFPKEAFRFPVKTFVVEADNLEKFEWVQRKLDSYKGRLIGAGGINVLTRLLTDKLIEKGYITSQIVIPEQNLKSGIMYVKVIPGYIEDIRFANSKTYGTWKSAFPCRKGEVLNIHDLEQGLEQMKAVPNQDASMHLEPGSTPHKSVVVIETKNSKSWSLGASLDDSGLDNTGRLQATGNIALYNPTGLNDIFSYSYVKDAEHEDVLHGTRNNSFYYRLPMGNYTVNVSHNYSEYHQMVPDLIPFENRGKTTSWDFGIQKVIYRDRARKTQLAGKIIRKHKTNYIDGEELRVQRLCTTAYQLGLMQRYYVGKGMFDGYLYYQKGMPWFNAEPGLDDCSSDYMTTRYEMWGLNLYYAVPFKLDNVNARYSVTFRGQYTPNMLYNADQFSIGGRYTVRGFSGEHTLAGDNGYIVRNEISFPLTKINLEPYLGVDYGYVWGPSEQNQMGNSLVGAVLGIRGKIGSPMSYDVFIGTPLYKPKGFKAGKTAAGFNVYWGW